MNNQDDAKFRGKTKTKHWGLALALHLYEQTRLKRTIKNWSLILPSTPLVVADKVGEYLDLVAARLADLFALVLADSTAKPSLARRVF